MHRICAVQADNLYTSTIRCYDGGDAYGATREGRAVVLEDVALKPKSRVARPAQKDGQKQYIGPVYLCVRVQTTISYSGHRDPSCLVRGDIVPTRGRLRGKQFKILERLRTGSAFKIMF